VLSARRKLCGHLPTLLAPNIAPDALAEAIMSSDIDTTSDQLRTAADEATVEGPGELPRNALPKRGVTAQDLQELNALMPRLAGHWVCETATDEGGEVRVSITESGGPSLHRRAFVVTRRGPMLHLMIAHLPYGTDFLGAYRGVRDVIDRLGDTVGWRRHTR
jgi:hypothetical protein